VSQKYDRIPFRPPLLAPGAYYPRAQPRFQSWGSNYLVYGITTLLQKKLDRSTQFRAVGYIITLYIVKKQSKMLGVRPNFGEIRTPSGCAHAAPYRTLLATNCFLFTSDCKCVLAFQDLDY